LLRQAEGLVAGVEEDWSVELSRRLDQPHDRPVVGGRCDAFLVYLQPLHSQIDDRLF
jgi:hypothetical protein